MSLRDLKIQYKIKIPVPSRKPHYDCRCELPKKRDERASEHIQKKYGRTSWFKNIICKW